MTPITFACEETLPLAAEEIAERMLSVANWTDFRGYGPLPGIRVAEFETRTPDVVGSRIRVTNRDGSSHVEKILQWQPGGAIRLTMTEFSPPLCRLATAFDETWDFCKCKNGTHITRTFQLHATSPLAKLPLRLIAVLLKKAIARHLRQMKFAS